MAKAEVVDQTPFKAALRWGALGWGVLPCCWPHPTTGACVAHGMTCRKPGKIPTIKRGVHAATKDPEQIRRWWRQRPHANVAIATGKVSDIFVLDVDPRHGGDDSLAALEAEHGALPDTVEAITGSGGRHLFFAYEAGLRNSAGLLGPGLDVKSDGGYVIVEPSHHVSGGIYRFEAAHYPGEVAIARAPAWLLSLLTAPSGGNGKVGGQAAPEIWPEGSREGHLVSLAGSLRRRGLTPEEMLPTLQATNVTRCQPPLEQEALERIARSIGSKPPGGRMALQFQDAQAASGGNGQAPAEADFVDGGKGKKKSDEKESQASTLVRLVEAEAILFHDQHSAPFAAIEVNGHREIWSTGSTAFRRRSARLFYEATGKVAGRDAVASALSVIEAKACFTGDRIELSTRVSRDTDGLWYDNSDPAWTAVRILPGKWYMEPKPPILFLRHAHQTPQVQAVAGGDPWRVFEFLPQVTNSQTRLLLLVWIVASFVDGYPVPLLLLFGGHGSGKTSFFRILRQLIDPSAMGTLTFPRDLAELVQLLSHHRACLFDNLSGVAGWQSDSLCRSVTGEGFSKRVLYSDDDDFLYSFRRIVALNGISCVATKADLLDRSILVQLDRISPEHRRGEEELQQRFESVRPAILGGIFDILSHALELLPKIKLETAPRMADFARWGCAIAQALEFTDQEFLAAYTANIERQTFEVIQGHPVAAALVALMEDRTIWEGSPAELHRDLSTVAEEARIDTRAPSWPRSAAVLGRRLREVRSNLSDAGLLVDEAHGVRRRFMVRKAPKMPSAPSLPSLPSGAVGLPSGGNLLGHNESDGNDSNDGDLPTLRGGVVQAEVQF